MSRSDKAAQAQREFEVFEDTVDSIMLRDDPLEIPLMRRALKLAEAVSEDYSRSQQTRISYLLIAERASTWIDVMLRLAARESPIFQKAEEMRVAGKSDKEVSAALLWEMESLFRTEISNLSAESRENLAPAVELLGMLAEDMTPDNPMHSRVVDLYKEVTAALAK